MAASYEARAYGVRSAMPAFQARRLCPELILVRTRFDAYQAASRQIREIFRSYTDLVEPLSLDEAYLDVTAPKRGPATATAIAAAIKREIKERAELTASAGVSFNKFLAKVASDLHKPDGLTVIRPEQAAAFIAGLPIERFFGIGPKTAEKMKALGIRNGADLRARPEDELVRRFGKVGRHYFRIVRAEDEREVQPDRPYKSIGAERRAGRRAHDRGGQLWPDRHPQDQAPRFQHHHAPAHPGRLGAQRRRADRARRLAPAPPRAAAPAGPVAGAVGVQLRSGAHGAPPAQPGTVITRTRDGPRRVEARPVSWNHAAPTKDPDDVVQGHRRGSAVHRPGSGAAGMRGHDRDG
jgi:hypothetical protein